MSWRIIEGDCRDVLATLPERSIDCVITTPQNAEQRVGTYGGIAESDYPRWTVAWLDALRPALKPTGSVLINIRPHVRSGQISDYVLRTRLALREARWLELDELIWRKPDAPPMGRIDRPRRSWESLHWFARSTDAFCDPKANGQSSERVGGLAGGRGVRNAWNHVHGPQNALHEGIARCADVVDISVRSNTNDCADTRHPAPYPVALAAWCIRLICPLGGTVLDPFCGSGSTGIAALNESRSFVGIEIDRTYAEMSRERIRWDAPLLNTGLEEAA